MPSAIEDLQEIADYIAEQLSAPESAIQLLEKVEEAIRSACAFPLSLPPVNDELLQDEGVPKDPGEQLHRVCPAGSEKRVLNVMRVLYHARDYFKEL